MLWCAGLVCEIVGLVFRHGVEAAQQVEKTSKSKDQQIDAYVAWMQRGILLREHARAVPKDRGYLADQAIETLEELILEVGEETALGQRAFFEMAKALRPAYNDLFWVARMDWFLAACECRLGLYAEAEERSKRVPELAAASWEFARAAGAKG